MAAADALLPIAQSATPAWNGLRPRALSSPGNAGCKLSAPSTYSPPALMVNSLRCMDSTPAPASPSVLWPPTPSPTEAFSARAAAELAFRAASSAAEGAPACAPPAALPPFGDAFFAPFVQEPAFFVPMGHMPPAFQQLAPPQQPMPAPQAPAPRPPGPFALELSSILAAPVPEHTTAPAWSLGAPPLLPVDVPAAQMHAQSQPPAASGSAGSLAAGGPSHSLGAELHGTGECRPCAWYYKPKGCHKGRDCTFCHMCLDGEIKNRKKAKVAAIRQSLSKP